MVKRLDVAAARNVPWLPTINLFYSGDPLPDIDTVALQVRLYAGASGSPLIDLAAITFEDGAATDAEIARAGLSAGSRVLRLFPEIAVDDWPDAAITGLNEPEAGEADAFAFDVVITYQDGAVERPIAGRFLLEPGVTV